MNHTINIAKLVAEYEAGESSTILSKRYEVSNHFVLKSLRDAGVNIRSKGGKKKIYDEGWTQAFVEAYKKGETIHSISKRMGVGQYTVLRALQADNIERRPHGLRALTVTIPSDQAKIAYFAGLLDGEGNLQLARERMKHLRTKLAIYNTNGEVLQWLVDNFGGTLRWQTDYHIERGWKPKGIWEVYRSRDVHALLQAALPYLIIKRDTARAMIAVFEAIHGFDLNPAKGA